jgi:8-oxo-dGTP pyrophosphatase MutT (NUDIX family)
VARPFRACHPTAFRLPPLNLNLPSLLRDRLAGPLPDAVAMLPYLARPLPSVEPRADARGAAVLVLLYPHEGRWCVPLTLRPSHMVDHAGQVSLPGGAIEPGETSADAAIREFHEELGAADMEVDLLGRLSTRCVMVSNYRVEPWVGVAPRRGRLVPNPIEVEQLLEVPLTHLTDPANLGSHPRQRDGVEYTAPHFQFQSYRIWGATCAILGELVALLGSDEP